MLVQQPFPQQVVFAGQKTLASQVGDWHTPLLQNAVGAWQMLPHLPQFEGSFCRLTQVPLQHIRPVVQSTLQTPLPPAPAPPADPAEPPLPPRPPPPLVPAMPVVPPRPAVPVVPPRPAAPVVPPRPAVPVVPPRPAVPVVPPRPAVPVTSEPPLPVLPAMPVVPPVPVVPAVPVVPPVPVPAAPPLPPPAPPAASIPPVTLPQAASANVKSATATWVAVFVSWGRPVMIASHYAPDRRRQDGPRARAASALVPHPLLERERLDAPARFRRRDVGGIADGVEPLEHQREVLAVGPHRRDRDLLVGDGLARQLAERGGRLRHGHRVARVFELDALELGRLGERLGAELPDVLDRDHLQLGLRLERGDQLVAVEEPGARQVLHEEHRPQDHVRRKAELLDRLLDAELVFEVGDAGLSISGADRRVDEVLHALVARHLREALALLFFLLDARLPGVLHREHAPRAADRALERRGVVQIARHQLRAERRQRLARVAVRLARHRAQLEAALLREVTNRRPTLLARCTGDQNDLFIRHGGPLFLPRCLPLCVQLLWRAARRLAPDRRAATAISAAGAAARQRRQ